MTSGILRSDLKKGVIILFVMFYRARVFITIPFLARAKAFL